MSRLILAALLALLVPGVVAAEQYYKWKDENGSWNYAAQPPKDKAAASLNIATGQTAAAAPAAADPGSDKAKAQAAPESTMAADADAIARIRQTQSANCERARTNVATLENNPRVQMDKGDGGGERPLTDDEQMQELQKARRQVEVFCNSR